MSMKNIVACFKVTESFEGGYANNPHDPGGATMKGVTQRVYSAWLKKNGLPEMNVKIISNDDIQNIYITEYWNAVRCDELYDGLDLVMADTAWGSGSITAIKMLQRALIITPDGKFGPRTLAAVKDRWNSSTLIEWVCANRMSFFKSLTTWQYFGVGWTRRLNEIRSKALAMNAPNAAVSALKEKTMVDTPIPTPPTPPPAPVLQAAHAPTVSGPITIDWGSFVSQILSHETPIIETVAQAGVDLALHEIPLGSFIQQFITPKVVKQYVDMALVAVQGGLEGQSIELPSTGVAGHVAAIAENLFRQGEPELVAFLGDTIGSWISGAVGKLGL